MNASTRFACWAIDQYRRHVSPRKGYRCAYALVHHDVSCSAAVERLIVALGPLAAIRPILTRFAACRAAYAMMPALGYSSAEIRGFCCCNGIPIPIPFQL